MSVWVVGVDPGKSTLGLWVHECSLCELSSPATSSFVLKQPMTSSFEVWKRIDVDGGARSVASYPQACIRALDKWASLWGKVDVVGIERQEDFFRQESNMPAYQNTLLTYFFLRCTKPNCKVMLIHSKLKFRCGLSPSSQTLVYQSERHPDAPRNTGEHSRAISHDRNKKYLTQLLTGSREKCLGMANWLTFQRVKGKKDDLCDAFLIGCIALEEWKTSCLAAHLSSSKGESQRKQTRSLAVVSMCVCFEKGDRNRDRTGTERKHKEREREKRKKRKKKEEERKGNQISVLRAAQETERICLSHSIALVSGIEK